jgi:simple sugar transport system permease protein
VLTAVWYFASDSVPNELTGTTPYVATLLVLAFASQRLRMPAADGMIYRKGEGH